AADLPGDPHRNRVPGNGHPIPSGFPVAERRGGQGLVVRPHRFDRKDLPPADPIVPQGGPLRRLGWPDGPPPPRAHLLHPPPRPPSTVRTRCSPPARGTSTLPSRSAPPSTTSRAGPWCCAAGAGSSAAGTAADRQSAASRTPSSTAGRRATVTSSSAGARAA